MNLSAMVNLWMAVWRLFRRARAPRPADGLAGAPVRARIKTYSADSAVYQYVYKGQQIAPAAIEYVFSISNVPGKWRLLSVRLTDVNLKAWEQRQGLSLTSTQKYAVAKLTLFQYLDEANGVDQNQEIVPNEATIARHLQYLDIA